MGYLSVSSVTNQGRNQQEEGAFEHTLSVALQHPQHLSSLTANICFNIAGYIARKLVLKLHCTHCQELIDEGKAFPQARNDHNYCFVDGR